jgi:uncharacterized protein YPO0396
MSDEHFDGSFLAKGGKEVHDGKMELRDRISKLEASFDWMKVIMATHLAITLGGFTFLGSQMMRLENRLEGRMDRQETRMDRIEAKLDTIPARLSEEFRATRAEMAAQTAAIASSVTAARAIQPQIVVMPPLPGR